MFELAILVAIGSSIWVFFDAPKHGLDRTWTFFVLMLWVIGFPWYLVARHKMVKLSRESPTLTPAAEGPQAQGQWETDPRNPDMQRWREGSRWTRRIRPRPPEP
jgi:hypothetical protein